MRITGQPATTGRPNKRSSLARCPGQIRPLTTTLGSGGGRWARSGRDAADARGVHRRDTRSSNPSGHFNRPSERTFAQSARAAIGKGPTARGHDGMSRSAACRSSRGGTSDVSPRFPARRIPAAQWRRAQQRSGWMAGMRPATLVVWTASRGVLAGSRSDQQTWEAASLKRSSAVLWDVTALTRTT